VRLYINTIPPLLSFTLSFGEGWGEVENLANNEYPDSEALILIFTKNPPRDCVAPLRWRGIRISI
jgi:hypothetical protein